MTTLTFRTFAPACTAALCLLACGASQGDRMKAEIQEAQAQQTTEKLVRRGREFAAAGDTTRAEQYFAAAIGHGGDERSILPMLLIVCIQDGRFRVAIEYASSYLKRHPGDTKVHLLLGTLYSAIGDAQPAHRELQRVLDERPSDVDAHYALAVLSRDNENDPVSADKHFREYLRLAPNGPHAEEAQASLLQSVR
jgi:tetratricopeptide (TPR) repeat protein